jgi:outer membrane protein OmpA-like peptidoglycan-associated protein
MLKRRRYQEEEIEETKIWTSFTDLMSNAFMILSLLLFITLIRVFGITQENQQLKEEVEQLRKEAPPVLIIQDSGDFKFASGSAVLPDALSKYIEDSLVDKIEEVTAGNQIYTVEIIGHTDGDILGGSGNLDRNLEKVALGNLTLEDLTPGSNADLGLMRALAVVKELQNIKKSTGKLQNVQFYAYSAAQLFLPNSGKFAPVDRQENPNRRRIEIRFSPLGEAEIIRK